MAINKKLIHFKTKANFNALLEAGNILDTSIVYIQDAKEIYTHGTIYGTSLSQEEVETIIANSETISDITSQISTLEGTVATNLTTAKNYTDQKISDLVGQAPEALNTIYELADAMEDNQSVVDALEEAIGNKVDSSSLATVATSGSYNDLSNKPTIPTTTSALTNDIGFLTSVPSEYVTETELETALGNIDIPAGYVAQDSEPTDTEVLWIDTDDGTEDSESIIAVDAYMSDTSTNPVQNMVVKEYIDNMIQVVTEAEYTALGDTVNTDGVIYLITE